MTDNIQGLQKKLQDAYGHTMLNTRQGLESQGIVFFESFQKHAKKFGLKIVVVENSGTDGCELDLSQLRKNESKPVK